MNDKILSLTGICKRAGKLTEGCDAVIELIQKDKAKLVVFANDFSRGSKRKVLAAAEEHAVKTLVQNRSKQEMGFALGRLCGVVAVSDGGFAKKLAALIENENKNNDEMGGAFYDKI